MKRISTYFISIYFIISSLAFAGDTKPWSLTSHDFTQAKVITRSGRVVLQATLTDASSKKLKEYSSRHVGEKLPIREGDRVIAEPVIRVPLSVIWRLIRSRRLMPKASLSKSITVNRC